MMPFLTPYSGSMVPLSSQENQGGLTTGAMFADLITCDIIVYFSSVLISLTVCVSGTLKTSLEPFYKSWFGPTVITLSFVTSSACMIPKQSLCLVETITETSESP